MLSEDGAKIMDDRDKKREEAIDALSRLVGFDVSDDDARPGDESLKRREKKRRAPGQG